MWIYEQSTGHLLHTVPGDDGQATLVAVGYSGFGADKNQPNDDGIKNLGPIPAGAWTIGAPGFTDSPGPHGPYVLPLSPDPGNDMHGRDGGFLIHGDSVEHPGTASHGCVILGRAIRERVWASGDRALTVVP